MEDADRAIIGPHLFLAFEFDSNCQALGVLAVRVEIKCFVSASFFDRFRRCVRSFSLSFRFAFDRLPLVFGSF